MTTTTGRKLAAQGAGLIAGVLAAVLGPHRAAGIDVSQLGQLLTALIAGIAAAVHAPKITHKIKHHRRHKHPPPPRFITVYDSVTVSAIGRLASTSTDAVAGYIDGRYQTIAELERDYPDHRHFTIAVNARDDADFLDVENGDALVTQIADWCLRQHHRGAELVGIYASLAIWPAIDQELAAARIDPRLIVAWVADWTGEPHIPRGRQGCQWTSRAYNRNLDESLFYASALRAAA